MQFTYKIENYYPYENRVFVVYTPSDTSYESLGAWVYVSATMTEQEIIDAVIAGAPNDKWMMAKSSVIGNMLGNTGAGTAVLAALIVTILTPEQIEIQRINQLWQFAHNLEYSAISGSAIGLITMGVLQSKPKCLAVEAWIKSIWTEYYVRKANDSTDYDFATVAGVCPYSVPELMAELAV